MNNLSSYCGLVNAKIRASDKDLPVPEHIAWMRIRKIKRQKIQSNQKTKNSL